MATYLVNTTLATASLARRKTPASARFRFVALCAATISAGWMGCASFGTSIPNANERATIQVRPATVLFRVLTNWENQPVDPLIVFNSKQRGLRLAIANLDKNDTVRAIDVKVSGLENENSRWCHLRLAPGTYLIQSLSPNLVPGTVRIHSVPAFWFIVPDSTPLVYAGTVQIDASGELLLNRGAKHQAIVEGRYTNATQRFETRFFDHVHARIQDDSEAAANFASTKLRSRARLNTILMKPYNPSTAFLPAKPALVVTESVTTITSPDWMGRSRSIMLAPSRWLVWGSSAANQAPIAAAGIAYLPVGFLLGSGIGKIDQDLWKLCEEKIRKALIEMNPGSELERCLTGILPDAIVPKRSLPVRSDSDLAAFMEENPSGTVILGQIRRIQLRECNLGEFCVEVAVRLQALDTRTKERISDVLVVYSNPSRKLSRDELSPPGRLGPQHEVLLPPAAPARPRQVYCRDGGESIFLNDVKNALNAAAEHIRR